MHYTRGELVNTPAIHMDMDHPDQHVHLQIYFPIVCFQYYHCFSKTEMSLHSQNTSWFGVKITENSHLVVTTE